MGFGLAVFWAWLQASAQPTGPIGLVRADDFPRIRVLLERSQPLSQNGLRSSKGDRPLRVNGSLGLEALTRPGPVAQQASLRWEELQGFDHLILDLPLELYVAGVLSGELAESWPLESMKAQAVAARTYALKHARKHRALGMPYDVEPSTKHQVLKLSSKHFGRGQRSPFLLAALHTQGQVLVPKGPGASHLYPVYFHAHCGGELLEAEQVWPQQVLGKTRKTVLSAPAFKPDPYCQTHYPLSWSIPSTKLAGLKPVQKIGSRVMVFQDSDSEELVPGEAVRKRVGYSRMKSLFVRASVGERGVVKGQGYGHGVGLCQWGARAQADLGKSHVEILRFYFSDAEISLFPFGRREDGGFDFTKILEKLNPPALAPIGVRMGKRSI